MKQKQIFDLYMQELLEIGHPIEYTDYKIQNIVACYKHQNKIDLNEFSRKYGFEYTPEIFPAVHYRDEIRNVGANIFHTDSYVILGAKSVATVNTTADIIRDMLDFLCDSLPLSHGGMIHR